MDKASFRRCYWHLYRQCLHGKSSFSKSSNSSFFQDEALQKGGFLGEFPDPLDGETLFQKAHNVNREGSVLFPAAQGILFLIRNPFEATIAEFKREKGHGHTSVVKEDIFSAENEDWRKKSSYYLRKWIQLLQDVMEKHTGRGFYVYFADILTKKKHLFDK